MHGSYKGEERGQNIVEIWPTILSASKINDRYCHPPDGVPDPNRFLVHVICPNLLAEVT